MATLFSNPLAIAQTAIGSVLDQRAVVLYAQTEFDDDKTALENEYGFLEPTVVDFVRKRQLTELFKGIEVPYLSEINGFNMWGISYDSAELAISSDICEHPIETGQMVADAAVLRPLTATVNIVMPTALYTQIYTQIEDYYTNKKKIMLLTKFTLHRNLVVSAMPHKLQHSNIDRPTISLSLRQIQEVEPQKRQYEGALNNTITQSQAGVYDDTSHVDVGRIHTDTISSVLAGGA